MSKTCDKTEGSRKKNISKFGDISISEESNQIQEILLNSRQPKLESEPKWTMNICHELEKNAIQYLILNWLKWPFWMALVDFKYISHVARIATLEQTNKQTKHRNRKQERRRNKTFWIIASNIILIISRSPPWANFIITCEHTPLPLSYSTHTSFAHARHSPIVQHTCNRKPRKKQIIINP